MPTTLPRSHYINRGVCPNCKCRSLMDGRASCEVCYEANQKWMAENRIRKDHYNKTRYEELKSLGLCVTCKLPTEGNVYCRTCTTKLVAYRALHKSLHSRNRWSKR